jgi:hypothetical protein
MASYTSELYANSLHRVSKRGRPPGKSLTVNSDGGSTVYVGARSSEAFGRVYDKGRESGTLPAGLWFRWELEAKQRTARAVVDRVLSSPSEGAGMVGLVTRWFLDRLGEGPPADSAPAIYNGKRETPTDTRLLHWLAVGVRPTVAKLVSTLGERRVLTALGLLLPSAVDALDIPHGGTHTWPDPPSDRSTR